MEHPHPRPALLSLQPDDPLYQALSGLAAARARAALGKEVELVPEAVDRSGHWAFVRGRLRDAGGPSLSLEGTPFAGQAAAGAASDLAVVLFRLDGEEWATVAEAMLPTGVAWLDWPRKHGAPGQLLGIG